MSISFSTIIQTSVILLTYIHSIASTLITCNNQTGCNWECGAIEQPCEINQFYCPSIIPSCTLTCIHCENIEIFSSSPHFNLLCTGSSGCDGINITSQNSSSNIQLSCDSDSSDSCSDITFNCRNASNCKCIDNSNNMCSNNDNIQGDFIIEQHTETYSTTPIISLSQPTNTNNTQIMDIYDIDDLPPSSNRNSTILNIILSSALLFTLIACVYLCINKVKSKPHRKQTDESVNNTKMDEYSEVHIDVNRLNSIVQSPRAFKPYKKNSEGFAYTHGSYVKKSTSAMESMYGEENNVIENTVGECNKPTNKLSNTTSEGNGGDGYFEKSKEDSDDNQLLYGTGNENENKNENNLQCVAQSAPIIAYSVEQ